MNRRGGKSRIRRHAAWAGLSWALAWAGAGLAESEPLSLGRALYLEGRRDDGQALLAKRAGGLTLRGAEAACVNCHRRSGFGGAEGRSYIPPINAAALFEAKAPGSGASAAGTGRPAYTAQTLARALRHGIDAAGRRLDYLMPRYEFSDAEVAALLAHLTRQTAPASPGVGSAGLDFATIVAPGVAAPDRQAMLDVLGACFAEHNAGRPPERGRQRLGPEIVFGGRQNWRLHVWTLEGAPETWAAQLAEHARRQPVFAVVGGLGGGQWAPVHQFCEASALPCLFPHLEVAGGEGAGFYGLYLNRGVQLEAGIMAHDLTGEGGKVQRVLQFRRAGDEAARVGAEALHKLLGRRGIAVEERVLDGAGAGAGALAEANDQAAVVLWLRDRDLADLAGLAPSAAKLYLSATLADPERVSLPGAWKERAHFAYPYELPEKRAGRTARLQAWLAAHQLPPLAGPVQVDAYLACSALGNGMNEIAGHLEPDYLVERLEVIMERTAFTGRYPRLALGAGQRYASKSGYLVRYADLESGRLVAVGERIAP